MYLTSVQTPPYHQFHIGIKQMTRQSQSGTQLSAPLFLIFCYPLSCLFKFKMLKFPQNGIPYQQIAAQHLLAELQQLYLCGMGINLHARKINTFHLPPQARIIGNSQQYGKQCDSARESSACVCRETDDKPRGRYAPDRAPAPAPPDRCLCPIVNPLTNPLIPP